MSPARSQSILLKANNKIPPPGNCAIKFEPSGHAADRFQNVTFVPNQIREMAAWVIESCVLYERAGGYVTRQLANTRSFLEDPNSDANFLAGFREWDRR